MLPSLHMKFEPTNYSNLSLFQLSDDLIRY